MWKTQSYGKVKTWKSEKLNFVETTKALDLCMLKPKSNALRVVEATLGKITEVKKPVSKFIIHIVELWLGMNCRYVFSNMGRWGRMNEKSYRNFFKKVFDWFGSITIWLSSIVAKKS